MNLFESNPYECNDLATLQAWVYQLQELATSKAKLYHQTTAQNGLLVEQNNLLKSKNAILEDCVDLLKLIALHD